MRNRIKGMARLFHAQILEIVSLKRGIVTALLYIWIFCIAIISYEKIYGYWNNGAYNIYNTLLTGGYGMELIFIPAVMYVALSLYQDIKNNFIYMAAERVSFHRYLGTRIMMGMVYSFAVTFLAMTVFTLILLGFWELGDLPEPNGTSDQYVDISYSHPIIYFMIRNVIAGIVAMFVSVVSMLLTGLFANRYVAVISGYFSYIVLDALVVSLGDFAGSIPPLSFVLGGDIRASGNIILALLHMCLIPVLSAICIKWILQWVIGRRYFDGKH